MTDVDVAAVQPGTPIPGQTKAEAQLEKGWGTSFGGRTLFWIAVAFSTFQIVTAMFSPLPSQIVRSVHVGFLMIVVFGVTSTLTDKRLAKVAYWALGIAGAGDEIFVEYPVIKAEHEAGDAEHAR